MRVARWTVMDAVLWVSTTFSVLVASRLLSLAIPTEYYFSFQSLFSDRPSQHLALAILSKMVGPLLVGFAAGWLLYTAARQNQGVSHRASLARRLRRRWAPSVFVGGFSAAFLGAWPMIVYWDLLANPEFSHLKPIFFLLYLLYMFAYGYMALLGLLAAVFLREYTADPDRKRDELVSIRELSRVGGLWLLNSGIATGALHILTK